MRLTPSTHKKGWLSSIHWKLTNTQLIYNCMKGFENFWTLPNWIRTEINIGFRFRHQKLQTRKFSNSIQVLGNPKIWMPKRKICAIILNFEGLLVPRCLWWQEEVEPQKSRPGNKVDHNETCIHGRLASWHKDNAYNAIVSSVVKLLFLVNF